MNNKINTTTKTCEVSMDTYSDMPSVGQMNFIKSIQKELYMHYHCDPKFLFKGTTRQEASMYIDLYKPLYDRLREDKTVLYNHEIKKQQVLRENGLL